MSHTTFPSDPHSAVRSKLLAAQGTYFVFRMLDGLATMATGVSRDIDRFDANGLFFARTLKTLLQHGEALPQPDAVLPSTQALANQLFHVSATEREQFAPAMALAWQAAFAELAAADEAPLVDAERGLLRAFRRALDDHANAQAPVRVRDFLAVQLLELCRLVHEELANELERAAPAMAR